ncbi:MAG: hypothetical protein NC033_02425 [Clostridiales bacterium]|nr:hypothetical protein [Clostridiales bacterium]
MILILAVAPCKTAFAAAPTYARAIDKEAYFCAERSENTSLFAVPYTYCVEVLREEGDWYYAKYLSDVGVYKAVYGYCKKEHFTPEYGTPQTTFLYKTVRVSFSAGGNPSSLPVLSEIALDAAYYGSYEAGGVDYSYVYCQGSFGYIEGAFDDYELNVPTHTPDDGGSGAGGGSPVNFATVAFIVIASLSVVIILIIYFTTKKPKIDG